MSVVALHEQLELDFERFCSDNSRILSLVRKSRVGEVQCPGAVDVRYYIHCICALRPSSVKSRVCSHCLCTCSALISIFEFVVLNNPQALYWIIVYSADMKLTGMFPSNWEIIC